MAAFHASASVATERRFFAWLCSAILAMAVVGFTRTYLPQGKPVLWDIRWEGGHTTASITTGSTPTSSPSCRGSSAIRISSPLVRSDCRSRIDDSR
jgi:hypothetical protein